MPARKRTRKNIAQIIGLLIAVVVVVTASVAFQHWWNNRPRNPRDIKVTVSWDGGKSTIAPYWVCDFDGQCPAGQAPVADIGGSGTVTVQVPRDVSDNRWTLLTIYDNPAANDEKLFAAGETGTVEVPATLDRPEDGGTAPKLLVVEVHSALVGTDGKGEETPYSVVWALHTTNGDPADATPATSATPGAPSGTSPGPETTAPAGPATTG